MSLKSLKNLTVIVVGILMTDKREYVIISSYIKLYINLYFKSDYLSFFPSYSNFPTHPDKYPVYLE